MEISRVWYWLYRAAKLGGPQLLCRSALPLVLVGLPAASSPAQQPHSVPCIQKVDCCPCPGCESFRAQYGSPAMGTAEGDVVGSVGASGADQLATPMPEPLGPAAQPAVNSLAGLSASAGASSGVEADTPNMIGDSTFGGCGGLYVGGVLAASVAHPTYACSRLNIAENNSPLVRDRVYMSYRHYHNATELDVFSYSPQGLAGTLDIDVYTLALEKRLSDVFSVEFRVPINRQFTSSPVFLQGADGLPDTTPGVFDGSVNNLGTLFSDTETDIGNLSLVFKRAMIDTGNFYLSAGLGLNLPTAPDVNVTGRVEDSNFPIFDPQNPNAPLDSISLDLNFTGRYLNETVSVQPFLAMVYTPTRDTFFQGFMQVDVPVNESLGGLTINVNDFDGSGAQPSRVLEDQLSLQTLLRINTGVGRWLYRNDRAALRRLGVMFEAHYTTTLNDAEVATITEVVPDVPPLGDQVNLSIGNVANRVDVVNLAFGVPLQIGMTTFYNGFITPITTETNRGFDFEYMLSINRQF